MPISRRTFLQRSGLAAAYLMLPAWLAGCGRATDDDTLGQIVRAVDAAEPLEHDSALHLLNRITYGPRPGDLEQVRAQGVDAFIEQQLHPEDIDDSAIVERLASIPTLTMDTPDLLRDFAPGKQPGPFRVVLDLQVASLMRATYSERQLFEIMVDLWSNHFNISLRKPRTILLKPADDREVIRAHALGKFRDLLLASARSPAMLVYLDNIANSAPGNSRGELAGGLNENYARELLELHTVGVDAGYSHADIVAVARVFTGWTVNRPRALLKVGAFRFDARLHDPTAKHVPFLGLDLPEGGGTSEGEELLAALASHPATARRVAHKLSQAFVSDAPPPALVERAAQVYLDNDTDIRATLAAILHSEEFRTADPKIKLPLRLMVSALRATAASVQGNLRNSALPLVRALNEMGQPFFGWAAPDGYPQQGAAWINSSGMLARWNFALALAEGRIGRTTVDLEQLANEAADPPVLVDTMARTLFGGPPDAAMRAALVDYVNAAGTGRRRPDLSGLTGLLLASPVFQLH